jgi:hypothetical protein
MNTETKLTWKEIALRGLATAGRTLLEFKQPANWNWRTRFYKNKSKVLSISIGETTTHYEGAKLVIEQGRLALPSRQNRRQHE